MKIAIVGPTGHVAGRTLEQLMKAGADVVALARHPGKLSVPALQGELEDGAFVAQATRGVDALLWLTPSTFSAVDYRAHTLALARNAAAAVRENSIQRVVFISSHGADRTGAGHASFAGEVEKLLEEAASHTIALRSAGFMENLFSSVDALRGGQLFGVLAPEKKYPLVTARDVGDVAAKWLLDPTWVGHHVRGVHGPEDLSVSDQVEVLSRVLGTTIRYQRLPLEALRANFLKRGASASVAQSYFDLFSTFAAEDYRPTEPRTAETTTPTRFETFVRESLVPRLGTA